jgi:hypothetical protein
MALTPSERSTRARIAAYSRWANTDSKAASEAARRRQMDHFEREVDPDGVLEPAERARRADRARSAHMQRLALASSKARRARRQDADAA